jgi:hypothetical protein
MPEMESFVILLMILIWYFAPAIVAFARSKNNAVAILVLNFLLGWTLLGWVISLVWALTKDNK